MVHNGWLKFTQAKNAERKPVSLEIPILPELQRIIDATTPLGNDTYLVTEFGRPFSAEDLVIGSASGAMRRGCPIARPMGCARPVRRASRSLARVIARSWRSQAIKPQKKLIATQRARVKRSLRQAHAKMGTGTERIIVPPLYLGVSHFL